MQKFRFHLLSLCHLPQHKKFVSCAFTQKNRKLSKMLISLGHEVFFYGSEGSDIEEYCNSNNLHYIKTHTLNDICEDYGDGYNLDDYPSVNYNVENCDFRHDFNSPKKPSTLKFYKNCIEHINEIKKPDDFLLCTQGSYHLPVRDAVGLFLNCEPGVGYRGSISRNFRAFESSYIQNFTYGSEHPFECINGSYYDRVIPNYVDPDDIEFSAEKDDYYLFIGRMIKRKGILTADLVCRHLGKKLIIAGQGAHVDGQGRLIPNDNPDFILQPGTWEYVGFVDVEKRKKLMAKAIATFVPTEYLECFGGVNCESRLSGTPVLTTDFGVFSNIIENGLDGYKCHTLDDFVWAAKQCKNIDHALVRKRAERYLMDYVRWEYEKWFSDLSAVYESTLSPDIKGWHRIREIEPEWRSEL